MPGGYAAAMASLHADQDMAAQLERTLIGAYADAADLGEALAVAGRVAAGDYDQDWQRVLAADPDMDAGLEGILAKPRDREFYGARMAAMGAGTFGEWLRTLTTYTLEGRAARQPS